MSIWAFMFIRIWARAEMGYLTSKNRFWKFRWTLTKWLKLSIQDGSQTEIIEVELMKTSSNSSGWMSICTWKRQILRGRRTDDLDKVSRDKKEGLWKKSFGCSEKEGELLYLRWDMWVSYVDFIASSYLIPTISFR